MTDGVMKRQRYIAMPSLELYMLIHAPEEATPDGRVVTKYIRVFGKTYFRLGLTYPGGQIELPFLSASVAYADVFENTTRSLPMNKMETK